MAKQDFDVLIIGAGLSGIGAGCHLLKECPGKTFAILEGRSSIGGTWDLFRYPGIRSDSDMYTLGYEFRPWRDKKAIADGPSILSYIRETANEHGIDEKIRYNHRVEKMEWSSQEALWSVTVSLGDGATKVLRSRFVISCTGYYRYEKGYMPEFPGLSKFGGQVIHPQQWPEDLDYSGKRIVVIGSGATAVTLVPSLAKKAKVTMLQRSPSYIIAAPEVDKLARKIEKFLPSMLAYQFTRVKNVSLQFLFYQFCRHYPEAAKKLIRQHLRSILGKDFDIDTHFTPSYDPWDQRLCLVPNADLFKVLRKGEAEIVTDHIDTFTKEGIRLKSGRVIEADIVVSATGLDLVALGGSDITVDGRQVKPSDTMSYKGLMLSGIPNFTMVMGYTNASWTLKADLALRYACRLIQHVDRNGYDYCVPEVTSDVKEAPFLDLDANYVLRAIDKLPKQGDRAPWKVNQNYPLDILNLRLGSIKDRAMHFYHAGQMHGHGLDLAAAN